MIVYFAITREMAQGNRDFGASSFNWKLHPESFLKSILSPTAGKLLDTLQAYNDIKLPYAICQAKVSDRDAIEAMRASLVGDVVTGFDVDVYEVNWIVERL